MRHTRGILALAAASFAPVAAAACLGTDVGCLSNVPVHTYALGDSTADTLTGQTCRHLYQFTVDSQTNVRFNVSSPGLQTFLQLFDQRGAIVMNSALTNSPDTATTVRMMLGIGDYLLAVIPVNPGQGGSFRFTTAADTAAVSGCTPIWVTPGITTSQTITAADCGLGPAGSSFYTHVYTLVLLQTQQISLTETSTSFPPQLKVAGQGNTVTSTSDTTGTTASITAVATIQGLYIVWAGSSRARQTGTYTLQIQ
ncbi:MAG: hypothetical protein ABSG61_12380 [Gemmatimonadales bacterium]|jgi:hypothetical protein